jgi:hypothetical protein
MVDDKYRNNPPFPEDAYEELEIFDDDDEGNGEDEATFGKKEGDYYDFEDDFPPLVEEDSGEISDYSQIKAQERDPVRGGEDFPPDKISLPHAAKGEMPPRPTLIPKGSLPRDDYMVPDDMVPKADGLYFENDESEHDELLSDPGDDFGSRAYQQDEGYTQNKISHDDFGHERSELFEEPDKHGGMDSSKATEFEFRREDNHEERALEDLSGIFRDMDNENGTNARPKTGNVESPQLAPSFSRAKVVDTPSGRVLSARKPVPVKKSPGEESQTILLTDRVEEALRERMGSDPQSQENYSKNDSSAPPSYRASAGSTKLLSRGALEEPPVSMPRAESRYRGENLGNRTYAQGLPPNMNPNPKIPFNPSPQDYPPMPSPMPNDFAHIGAKGESNHEKLWDLSPDEFSELVERAVEKALAKFFSRLTDL